MSIQSTSIPTSGSNKYSLNYFNRVGKIELVKLIFAVANVKYVDNYVENLTDSDVQLGLYPYLEVNNSQIPLISVIARFLAKEFNLAGRNNLEQAKTDAIEQNVMLLVDSFYRNVHNQEDLDQKRIALKAFIAEDVENAALTIEQLIGMYSEKEGFCVGNQLTYADLFVFEMASHYFPTESSFYDRFPNIFKVKSNIEENPNVVDYLKSNEQIRVKFSREF